MSEDGKHFLAGKSFNIEWCELCKVEMVICPVCGNNSCNGGSGEVDGKKCPVCPTAYELMFAIEKITEN